MPQLRAMPHVALPTLQSSDVIPRACTHICMLVCIVGRERRHVVGRRRQCVCVCACVRVEHVRHNKGLIELVVAVALCCSSLLVELEGILLQVPALLPVLVLLQVLVRL